MSSTPVDRRVMVLLVGLQLTGALFLLLGPQINGSALGGLPLDDAWIHLVYARSFAERFAFEYNRGTLEAGMSSPLWVIVLGSVLRLAGTEAPVAVAKACSLAFGIAGVIGSARLGAMLAGTRGALFAGLALVALPEWTYAALSGMETTAAGAVLVWLGIAILERRRVPTIGLLALAPLVRPELLLPVAVLGLFVSQPRRTDPVGSIRRFAVTLLPAALGVLAWVGYHILAVGRPLPNTFYVKVDRPVLAIADALVNLPSLWIGPLAEGTMLGGAFLIAALVPGARGAVRHEQTATVLWAATMLFLIGVLAVAPQGYGGSNHYFRRYYDPALPALAGFAARGGLDAVSVLRRLLQPRSRLVLAAASLVLVTFSVPTAWQLRQVEYASQTQAIYRIDITLSRWLAANVPPGKRIATYEAGATKWHLPEHEVIDINGLNTAGAVRLPLVALLEKYQPHFLATWSDPAIDALPVVEQALVRIGFNDVGPITPQEMTVWKLRDRSGESILRVPSDGLGTLSSPRE